MVDNRSGKVLKWVDAGDFSLRSKGIAVGVSVIFQDPRQIDFDGGSYASPGAQV